MPAELGHRQVINHFLSPLQQFSTLRYDHISTLVPGIDGRADDITSKRQNSLTHIALYQADYIIYNDGSASERTGNKSAAAVITTVPVLQPEVLTTIKRKGRLYDEEASDT